MSFPTSSRRRARRSLLAIAAVAVLLVAAIGTQGSAGAAATPSSTLAGLGDTLIGEEFTFTATFDNTGTDTGYAPFIDLLFPVNGADGAAGTDTADGVEFVGVDYLGLPVRVDRLPIPDDDGAGPGTTGTVEHPLTGELITATAGDELVVLSAPFGSFAPGQPPADLTVTARLSPLADAGVPLGIGNRSGFALGETPLDDPATDPPLLGDPDTDATSWSSTDVVPTVLLLDKEYLGPEDETATGPNFPRQYRITVDLPDGQTVTDLDLVDAFPDELAFLAVDSITPAGTVVAVPPVGASSTGSTIEVNVPTVTGSTDPDDVVVLVSFFVDRLDGSGAEVVDAASGAPATVTNAVTALGDWDPVDGRDDASADNVAAGPAEDSFTARAVATQKSVRNLTDGTNSPGDLLEYTIDVQVSDHLAVDDLVLEDVLSDGQRLDPTFVPTMTVSGATSSATAAMSQLDVTDRWTGAPAPVAPLDGTTRIELRVSDELADRGLDPVLRGGCVPPGGTGGAAADCAADDAGATTVQIVLRTVIQADFSDDAPTGDASVDQGDLLDNTITARSALLDAADLAPTGGAPTDTSSAGIAIAEGGFTKGLYLVNGAAPGDPATVAPGDEVTWRLTYRHPTSGFEDFVLEDFLPLPAFDATEVTTFDAGTVSAAAPAAGTAHYHPGDTFRALPGAPAPALSSDAGDNALSFDYGTYDVDPAAASVMDLLFTVTVTDVPLADQLLLTNIAQSSSSNTNGAGQVATDGVQVELTEPELTVTKGVVATDAVDPLFAPDPPAPAPFSAPGGAEPRHTGTIASDDLAVTPIDANLTRVDAGDLVTFAITVENTGSGTNGAFDVTVSDDLPAGFVVPAGGINLGVVDGTGATLAVTELAGGLLGSGVRLDDGADTGSLGPVDPTAGTNLAIITYDLEVAGTVEPGSTLTNTASLDRYAGTEGGPNHLDDPATDDAEVTVDEPTTTKSLVATSEAHTDDAEVAIGEIARFRIETVVPEGTTSDASVTDVLPAGLEFLDDGTATAAFVSDGGTGLTSSALNGPGLGADGDGSTVDSITPSFVLPPAALSGGAGDGADVTVELGTLANADDDADVEIVVIELNALVRNTAPVQAGVALENRASFGWASGSTGPSDPVEVTVVEPSASLTKSVTPPTGADAGDSVTYSFGLTNGSGVDAFEASLVDTVDPRIVGPTVDAIVPTGGASGIVDNSAGSTIDVEVASLPAGSSVSVTVSGTLASSVEPGDVIPNTAEARWTSLPGDGTASNPTGSAVPGDAGDQDGERDGSGGVNDLRVIANAQTAVAGVAATKSIVATSEAHTSGSSVAIGEIVRYRLVATLPEGTATAVRFVDLLPTGLRALLDGTARVAFVSDAEPITSSTLADPPLGGLVAVGDESTIDAITPVATLPPGALSAGSGSGDDLTVSLGDLTNPERDADDEFVVVEFNALVDNTASNDDGATRNNRFRVRVDGSTAATSQNVAVTVREPRLTLAKTFPGVASPDAADTVNVRIVATNTGSATAFEPVLGDVLPDGLTPQGPVSVAAPAGVTVLDDSVVGDTVQVELDQLAPGQSVSVEFDAVVANDIEPDLTVTNTATAVWSSLPGSGTAANPTGATAPGGSGDVDGERDGSGGVNDHATSDDATLTTRDVAATKVLTGTDRAHTTGSTLAVGEEATFTATLTIPEGETPAAVFTDEFDAPGFELVSVMPSLGADLSAATPNPTPVTAPGSVVLDFGDITNTPDGVDDAEDQLVVTVVLRVANVAGSDDGVVISNTSASLAWSGGSVTSGAVPTAIAEPQLVVDKSMSPFAPDAGDIVTVTVTVEHAPGSSADAFDVALTDAIPAGLTYVPGSVADVGAVAADVLSGSSASVDAGWDDFPLGAVGSLSFEATLDADVAAGQVIANTAAARWTSLPGAVAGERTGDGGVDDHADADTATIAVPTATIDKSAVAGDHAPSVLPDVVVGETVTYAVDLTFPEGVTGPFDLVDDIPAGMAYVAASFSVDDAALAGTLSAFDVDEPTGDGADLAVAFTGDTTVTADGDPSNDAVTVTYQLVVLDVVGNGDGAELTNTASAFGDSDDVTVTAVRPDLSISKDDGGSTGSAGAIVVYTLSYANDGGIAAPSSVVTEVVPGGVVFSSAGSTPGWSCVDGAAPGTTCVLDVGDVAPGAGGSVDFAVRLPDPVPAGFESVENAASIADDGSNGADVDTDDQTSDDTTPVDAAPVLEITKDDGGAAVNPGDTIAYALEVTNTGDQAATGVVVAETVPANTTFDASGSNGGWSCADGSPAATACELTIGDLAVGASSTAVFSVLVDEPVPGGVIQVANAATASDDGAGTGGTPVTDSDADTTPVTAEADLSIVKSTSTPSVDGGDEVRYRLQLANAGPNAAAAPVTVTDVLPPEVGLDSVDGAGSGWTCSVLDNGFTCTYGNPAIDAPVGTLGEIEVIATAAVDVDGTVTNTATIGSSTDDPDESDNSSSAPVELRATADLSIAKSHAPASFVAGGTGTFTLAVANEGPSDAVATVDEPITVVDPMPDGITISGVSATGWDCAATTPDRLACDWTATIPAAGPDPAAIVISVDVADDVVDVDGLAVELDNTATVAPGRTPDENPDNDDATDRVTVDPSADLGIEKVLDGELVAGDPAAYVLTVSNSGPSTVAGDITVVDDLPDGLSFSDATSDDPWDCSAVGDEVTCTLAGPTPVGAESTIRLEVLVDPDAPSPVVNSAEVGSDTSDPDPTNNVDATDGGDDVTTSVDLSVAKSAPPATATVGGTVEFTLVVSNAGPNATVGTTTLTDTLPDGLVPETIDAPVGWSCDPVDGQELRCTSPDVIPVDGSVGPFRVVARVGPAAYPSATNVARVAADPSIDEDDPTNDADDATVVVESSADLAIDKSHQGQFAVGVGSRWRLVVTNDGPTTHPGPFTVSDPLPAGITPVAAAGDGVDCTIAAQVVTCVHPDPLVVGGSAAIDVDVLATPGAEGKVTNTATVTSPETDPVPGNDADSDEVVVAPSFDLSVDKALDGTPTAGDEVDWLLVVTNAGPSPSTDITLEDRLPDGLVATDVDAEDPAVDCDLAPDAVICVRPGRLEVGGQFTVRLTTEVTAPAGSEVRNVAAVSADGDRDATNDSDAAAGTVEARSAEAGAAGAAGAAPPAAGGAGASTPRGTLPRTGGGAAAAELALVLLAIGVTAVVGSAVLRRRRD